MTSLGLNSVQKLNIKIRMARGDGYGVYRDLPDNGIVSSSMLGVGDERIKVWIENKPDFFLKLKLTEIPAVTGKDMLLPKSISYDHPNLTNDVVVFPDPDREYYFDPAPNAGRGQFVFKLYNKDGTQFLLDSATAEIGNDYLDFTCVRTQPPQTLANHTGSCTGNLEIRTANGTVVQTYNAVSGEDWGDTALPTTWFYPALPDSIYTFDQTEDKRQGTGFCDNFNNCWWAPIIEQPFDINAFPNDPGRTGRTRGGLGIHPRRRNKTHGCIGFDPTFNSSNLRNDLDDLCNNYGPIRVIVHP